VREASLDSLGTTSTKRGGGGGEMAVSYSGRSTENSNLGLRGRPEGKMETEGNKGRGGESSGPIRVRGGGGDQHIYFLEALENEVTHM